MSTDEDYIEDQFQIIQEESFKAFEQVQLHQRKVTAPIYEKRREIVKPIPNFWSTAALESLIDFHVEHCASILNLLNF
ncbi:hypothetical protein BY458DRAFT_561198 [Sporodiniella umbellata]|nr:hypothetical protein BY458DRAFT_561198 [Sporodiniella umbellata]